MVSLRVLNRQDGAMDQPDDDRPDAVVVRSVSTSDPGIVVAGESAARAVFGVASVLAAAVVELLAPTQGRSGRPGTVRLLPAADVALAVTWQASTLLGRAARATLRVAAPVTGVLMDPPLVPPPLRPATHLRRAVATWHVERPGLEQDARLVWDRSIPLVVGSAIAPIDLTQLVLDRVRLGEIVEAALDDLDLTEIVLTRVDLRRVIEAALDQLDLTEVVVSRVDVLGLAEYVVNGIDLPEIMRSSTGSMASESLRTVRVQGVEADEAVARIVDRVLAWRRTPRRTDAPGDPESLTSGPSADSDPS